MKRYLEFLWPALGLVAVVLSIWLLSKDFKGEAVASQVWEQLGSISWRHYAMSVLCACLAYTALAWYDRIALRHLGIQNIPLGFVAITSFTTYALSHTIGVSVFSGAMVRYRAYSSRGLSTAEVTILVAVTSITFLLGTLLVGGIVLAIEPKQLAKIASFLPSFVTDPIIARLIGFCFLAAVLLYVVGSVLRLPSIVLGKFRVDYPRPNIALRQLIAAPLELLGAAGIIYFALPEAGNPGFFVVLAIFVGSFSAALVSNAPAGVGVFDWLFIKALEGPDGIDKFKVFAAILIFRLFYLVIPLAFAIVVVVLFERGKIGQALARDEGGNRKAEPPAPAKRETA